jgi:uncharacterized membrane protein YvlD (DUF360 family)
MKLIVKWLCSAAALLAVAYLYSGVSVNSFPAALLAAAVLGALNTVVRPVLVLLTLPVTLCLSSTRSCSGPPPACSAACTSRVLWPR